MTDYRFHFSLGRMFLLMAMLGAWFAAWGVLPGPWLVWSGSVVVYLAVVLCFSSDDGSVVEPDESPGGAGT